MRGVTGLPVPVKLASPTYPQVLHTEVNVPSSEVMGKFQRGRLHSGSKSGPVVKNHKQAIAILLSERRNEDEHGGEYQHPRSKPKRRKS